MIGFKVDDWHVMLSNATGSLSLACWIILLMPQLLEQWRLKTADGIAIGFIGAWFLGDLANFAGALIGKLRPNVTLLALWFCFSDTLLVLSYFYYKRQARIRENLQKQRRSSHQRDSHSHSQTTPLLQDDLRPRISNSVESVSSECSDSKSGATSWMLTTAVPFVIVIVVATVAYMFSEATPGDGDENAPQSTLVTVLGYFSALMYLAARVPQIVQNHRRRSVEGLSIGFFILSIVGNLTYAAQIVIYRSDPEWLWAYFPWLLGSLGTILEDSIIFAQFFLYQRI